MNHRLAGGGTTLHFAPTEFSRQNLLRENVPDSRICVAGNTVIDALLEVVEKVRSTKKRVDTFAPQYPYLNPTN